MMIAIGIDAVDIKRFAHWHRYKKTMLLRFYSSAEIDYCMNVQIKSAERFAVRFSAKEAFFKALYQLYPLKAPGFLKVTFPVYAGYLPWRRPQCWI